MTQWILPDSARPTTFVELPRQPWHVRLRVLFGMRVRTQGFKLYTMEEIDDTVKLFFDKGEYS